MSISGVEIALAQGRGIVCLNGVWLGDEIVLRECYIEGQLGGVDDPDAALDEVDGVRSGSLSVDAAAWDDRDIPARHRFAGVQLLHCSVSEDDFRRPTRAVFRRWRR